MIFCILGINIKNNYLPTSVWKEAFIPGFISNSNNIESVKNNIMYLHADYNKDYSQINLLDEYDYSFVGIIDKYITTKEYDGTGTNIPYTYYRVIVLDVIKGQLDNDVIIKFYGGKASNGETILLNNTKIPEKGKIYKFYCNKTKYSPIQDTRTIENSYVINSEYNMTLLEDYVCNSVSKLSISPDFSFDHIGGGGGYSNTSFDTAYDINYGETSVYLSQGVSRYYKLNFDTLNYISLYSTGSLDTKVEIYDSNYCLYKANDDVTPNSRGTTFTSNTNFFTNFYSDKDETYYIKVSLYDSSKYGSFNMHLVIDNWTQTLDLSDLFWEYDGVDGNNKVDYTIKSKYVTEIGLAMEEWNKLGTIRFSPDSGSTINDITVSYYIDVDSNTVAVTTYRWLLEMTVEYNDAYFSTMSRDERIKTCLHEFGHVLGLDEFTNVETTSNVMYQGIRGVTTLGPADIAVYRAKWN